VAILLCVVLGLMSVGLYVRADDSEGKKEKIEGVWVHHGRHTNINVFCQQPWICRNKDSIMHGSKMKCTSSEVTHGACNSGGDTIDGCAFCAAAEPETECYCWLE